MRLHAESLEDLSSLRWALRTSKDVHALFEKLEETKKEKFEALAATDKARYDVEFAKYQASLPPAPKDDEVAASKTPVGMTMSKRPSSTMAKNLEKAAKRQKREKLLDDDDEDSSSDIDEEDEARAAGYKSEQSSDEDYLTASEGAPIVPGPLVAAAAVTAYAAGRPRREVKPAPAPAIPPSAARPPASSHKAKPTAPKPPAPIQDAANTATKAKATAGQVSSTASKPKSKASSSASPFTPLPQILTKSVVKKIADAKAQEKVVKKAGSKKGGAKEDAEEEEEEEVVAATLSKVKVPVALKVSPAANDDSSEDLPEWVLNKRVTRSAAKHSS